MIYKVNLSINGVKNKKTLNTEDINKLVRLYTSLADRSN